MIKCNLKNLIDTHNFCCDYHGVGYGGMGYGYVWFCDFCTPKSVYEYGYGYSEYGKYAGLELYD